MSQSKYTIIAPDSGNFTQSKISQTLLSLQAGPEEDEYCRMAVLK